jgi:tRNA(fMet)-specific endonuclease VapC
MAIRYLLDTNTASYIIKGNFPHVREKLLKVSMADVGISVITEAELRFGAAKRPEAIKLQSIVEDFLRRVDILPWDSLAAQHYAEIRAKLERAGEPMGNLDMMIAAQALAIGAVLVSSDNVFGRIKHLKTEDWKGSTRRI